MTLKATVDYTEFLNVIADINFAVLHAMPSLTPPQYIEFELALRELSALRQSAMKTVFIDDPAPQGTAK